MRRRRHPARGAPVHPGVPRQDGRHQVRRRGDDRPGAARGLRPRRRAAQVRRPEPDHRPRRRAGDHRLHEARSTCRSSSSAACASATPRPSRSRRWSSSARSTRTSSCASTATGSRRSGSPATTASSSASRRCRARAARTSASSGEIERVDTGVINHIAEDYIPVIASVGADRAGRSHNVNADEAAGAVARALGAYKVIFLTDVAGWLRDPADPDSVISEATADEVEAAIDDDQGGMRPKLQACVDAIHGGVTFAAHHRRAACRTRCCSSCSRTPASARRCRPARHERCATDLRALPGRVRQRARAARWSDAEGDEYLDFLAGIAVNNVGHCHPRVVAAVQEQVGRLMHVSNLFYTDAERAARRAAGAALAGRRRCSSATPAPRPTRRRSSSCARRRPRGDIVVAHGAFHGRTYGALSRDAAGGQAGAVRAARARASGAVDAAEAIPAPSTSETAAVLIEPIQGESGVNLMPTSVLRVDPRGLRRGRRRAGVRRGPDRHGPHRHAVGLRAARRRAGRDDAGQGARRRPADRRAGDRPEARGRASRPATTARPSPAARSSSAAAHAVLDVHRRRGVPGARRASAASACWRACASCRASLACAAAG